MGHVYCIFFSLLKNLLLVLKMILNSRGLFLSQEIGSAAIMTREEDLCRLVCTYAIFLLFFGTDNQKI